MFAAKHRNFFRFIHQNPGNFKGFLGLGLENVFPDLIEDSLAVALIANIVPLWTGDIGEFLLFASKAGEFLAAIKILQRAAANLAVLLIGPFRIVSSK